MDQLLPWASSPALKFKSPLLSRSTWIAWEAEWRRSSVDLAHWIGVVRHCGGKSCLPMIKHGKSLETWNFPSENQRSKLWVFSIHQPIPILTRRFPRAKVCWIWETRAGSVQLWCKMKSWPRLNGRETPALSNMVTWWAWITMKLCLLIVGRRVYRMRQLRSMRFRTVPDLLMLPIQCQWMNITGTADYFREICLCTMADNEWTSIPETFGTKRDWIR